MHSPSSYTNPTYSDAIVNTILIMGIALRDLFTEVSQSGPEGGFSHIHRARTSSSAPSGR